MNNILKRIVADDVAADKRLVGKVEIRRLARRRLANEDRRARLARPDEE